MNTWKDSQLDRVKVRQSRIEGNRRKERQNRTEKKDRIGQKRKKVIEKDGERERKIMTNIQCHVQSRMPLCSLGQSNPIFALPLLADHILKF